MKSEIAKTSRNVERANKTRKRSVRPKSWSRSFSGYRFFPDLSLSEFETTCIHLHLKHFSAKCTENISRYLHFKQLFRKMRQALSAQFVLVHVLEKRRSARYTVNLVSAGGLVEPVNVACPCDGLFQCNFGIYPKIKTEIIFEKTNKNCIIQ